MKTNWENKKKWGCIGRWATRYEEKIKREGWGSALVLDVKYGYFYPIKIYVIRFNLDGLMDFLLNMSLI